MTQLDWHDSRTGYRAVSNKRELRLWALVVFGAGTGRPTIVCLPEDALPASPGPDWLVLARDSDLSRRVLSPPDAPDATPPA
jgi:hypothetical protein